MICNTIPAISGKMGWETPKEKKKYLPSPAKLCEDDQYED